jgi:hypothetical protein
MARDSKCFGPGKRDGRLANVIGLSARLRSA